MSSSPKTTIAPMLSVRNGAKAVDFYKAAFGAEVIFRLDDPGGAVVAQLSVNGAEFWLADESPEHLNFSPQTLNGGTVRIILTTDDPDAAYRRAILRRSHRRPGYDQRTRLAHRKTRRSLRPPLGDRQTGELLTLTTQ